METHNLLLKTDERENLKIKYKNQRLQQAKQVYLCECQKNYLSFPALYLHVKNKHRIKLTTKITEKICKMEERNGKTYITYFLRNQDEQEYQKQGEIASEDAKKSSKNEALRTLNEDQCDKGPRKKWSSQINEKWNSSLQFKRNRQNDIKSIVQQYLRETNYHNLYTYQCSSKILKLFIDYIQKCCLISKQFENTQSQKVQRMIEQIPLFFNQFICCFLPCYFSLQMEQIVQKGAQIQIMKLFGSWLREKQYTNLLILESM